MLVLTRRPAEKIVLPTVPAVVKVIATQAGLCRLGIEAPDAVPILREELFLAGGGPALVEDVPAEGESVDDCPPQVRHYLRNRLNNLVLGLALLRMQVGNALDPVVRKTLTGLEEEVERLREYVLGDKRTAGREGLAGTHTG